jgi:glycerol kinase
MPYILALDQGTTSSRAMVFDGHALSRWRSASCRRLSAAGLGGARRRLSIWHDTLACARLALDRAALGAPTSRRSASPTSGKPSCCGTARPASRWPTAIVWQDRRTADTCAHCGPTATKRGAREDRAGARPLLLGQQDRLAARHLPGARERASARRTGLRHDRQLARVALTGGQLHMTTSDQCQPHVSCSTSMPATGTTGCSRCSTFREPAAADRAFQRRGRPKPMPTLFGVEMPDRRHRRRPAGGAVRPGLHAAGLAKNTYGTGCFMLMHTGTEASRRPRPAHHLCRADLAAIEYALEGSVFVTGALVQWLRDGLGMISRSADIEALAASVPDSGGVTCGAGLHRSGRAALVSRRSGAIYGLTRGSTRAHIARAALESIALQTLDVMRAMEADAGAACANCASMAAAPRTRC